MKNLPPKSPVTNAEEYIHSSLIHEVYLNNDLKADFPKFWGRTGIAEDGFGRFFQDIKELALTFDSISKAKPSHLQTVSDIIVPVLSALGWTPAKDMANNRNLIITSKFGDETAIKPSIILFQSEADNKHFFSHYKTSTKPSDEFSILPVATTYFGSWADQRSGRFDKDRDQLSKFGDVFSALGTDEQVYNHLDLLNSEWGISTDGHSWRLIKRSAFAIDHTKYFEFNLDGFISAFSTAKPEQEDALIDVLKHFYWFFSKESHQLSKPNQISLTWERSKKYTDNLEDDLRARFVAAISIAVNSLWSSSQAINIHLELDQLQDIAESIIYNALFIRSCESRRVLPLHQNYIPVSLHNLLAKLRDFDVTENSISGASAQRLKSIFQLEIEGDGSELFDYLINLFELTNNSERKSKTFGFSIVGFKENIFSKAEWGYLKKVRIDNLSLAKILHTLFFLKPDVQLPFNILTPQQFGSIFESFLEFKLAKVNKAQYLIRRRTKSGTDIFWSETPKSADDILYCSKRGSLYFRPDKSDRKVSGSYYTPDYVVDMIVRETVTPFLATSSAEKILKMRICDPAMGSGHFLISTLRLLTSEYLKKSNSFDISSTAAKQRVLHNCIFGVDKNPRAVKLAKLAIWLETAQPNGALEHLDEHLLTADSLMNESLWLDKTEVKFNAVVGNPPYINTKLLSKEHSELKNYLTSSRRYSTCAGNFDIYIAFLELSIRHLTKEDGRVGFILPNKLNVAGYAEGFREFAIHSCDRIQLTNVSQLNVFGEVGVYPVIYVMNKSITKGKVSSVEFFQGSVLNNRLVRETLGTLVPNSPREVWSDPISLSSDVEFLDSNFLVDGGVPGYQAQEMLKIIHEGKSANSAPFVVSGNIQHGSIEFGDVRYMKHHFKSPYMTLDNRVLSEGKINQFKSPKLVIAGMTKMIRAAYFAKPLGIGVGVYSITAAERDLKWLNVLLNSIAFGYVFRKKFEDKHLAGGYLAINAGNLAKTPVPFISDVLKDEWAAKEYPLSLNDSANLELMLTSAYKIKIQDLGEISKYLNERQRAVMQALEASLKKAA